MERPVPASPNLPLIALLWLLRCGYGFTVFCCCCRRVWGSSATRVDKATFLKSFFFNGGFIIGNDYMRCVL